MTIAAAPPRWPTLRELHDRRCFLLGITEATKVERLWKEEVEQRNREKKS